MYVLNFDGGLISFETLVIAFDKWPDTDVILCTCQKLPLLRAVLHHQCVVAYRASPSLDCNIYWFEENSILLRSPFEATTAFMCNTIWVTRWIKPCIQVSIGDSQFEALLVLGIQCFYKCLRNNLGCHLAYICIECS